MPKSLHAKNGALLSALSTAGHSDGLILLGSIGFLDGFTVTASRFAQAVAIEDREAFDDRFGIVN